MALICKAPDCSKVEEKCLCKKSARRRWQAIGHISGDKRWYVTSDESMTLKEAKEWFEKERLDRRENRTPVTAASNRTILHAAQAYLTARAAAVEAGDCRAATYDNHVGIVNNYLIPFFSGKRLSAITPADVQSLVTELRKGVPSGVVKARLSTFENYLREKNYAGGDEAALRARIAQERERIAATRLSSRTVRMIVDTLGLVLNQAILASWITTNAATAAKFTIKADAQERFALNCPERDIVAWATEGADPRDRLPILLMMRYGLRRGECFGLQRRDIDSETGRLRIERILDREGEAGPVKAKSDRSIPAKALDAALFRELEVFARARKVASIDGTDWLFTTKDGGPCSNNQDRFWRSKVIPALVAAAVSKPRAAELRTATFHHLRHTAATWMQEELGLTQSAAGKVLGHRSTAMTEHYTDLSLDGIEATLRNATAAEPLREVR